MTRRLVYLARHGLTQWNVDRRMQGHIDVPLNPEGQAQAERLAGRLVRLTPRPAAVWTSDLQRARQTAEAIGSALGAPLHCTPLLRETHMGRWEGLTQAEIQAADGELLALYRSDPGRYRPPGSERVESSFGRILQAMAAIRESCPGDDVVVVGHGGSLRAVVCHALGGGPELLGRIRLDNASLSIVEERSDREPRLLLLNDTSHL